MMKPEDQKKIVAEIKKLVDDQLVKNQGEIIKAYETLQKKGGLKISIGITMKGNLSHVGGQVKLMFDKDKFSSTQKLNIELRQQKLPFEVKTDAQKKTKPGGKLRNIKPKPGKTKAN